MLRFFLCIFKRLLAVSDQLMISSLLYNNKQTLYKSKGKCGEREGNSQSTLWDLSIPRKLFVDWLSNGRVFSETSANQAMGCQINDRSARRVSIQTASDPLLVI